MGSQIMEANMTGFHRKLLGLIWLPLALMSCAAPLKTDTVSFKTPESYANHQTIDGLRIAVIPIDSLEKSEEIFGTDLWQAGILPVHLIVQNNGTKEFEINHAQIFGITPTGEMTSAYSLNKSAEHVRSSSIGTTAVAGAVAGAVVGTALGAAVGAGVGYAAGDAGTGAVTGTAIGGAAGIAQGTAAGLSDSFTVQFKRELANLAFGDRAIYPSDIQQGFIYLKWNLYSEIGAQIFNITDNTYHALKFPLKISR